MPLAFIFLPHVVFAAEDLKNITSAGDNCAENVCKDLCGLIKSNLKRGVDAKALVKTNIQLGNRVCNVIKCSIDGGADLGRVVAGAVEAGSTSDVISRCLVEAGVKVEAIEQVLQSQPQQTAGESSVFSESNDGPDLNKNAGGGGDISPSSF